MKLAMIICLSLMFVISAGAASVNAATPTPTLHPVLPTATSVTLYLRPTPTLWNIATPVESFPLNEVSSQLGNGADLAIQVYHMVNKEHQIDMMAGAIVAFATVTILIGWAVYKMNKEQ